MSAESADPAIIDSEFVPRFRDQVAAIPVQDEAVLYEVDTGRIHQLDPIAAIVCNRFDGNSSIATAVDELATAFGVDRETVEADVLELTRQLGYLGLFEGVQGHDEDREDDLGEC